MIDSSSIPRPFWKTVRLWDLAGRQEVRELRGHAAHVHAVAFSPDGTRLALASGGATVCTRDIIRLSMRARTGVGTPGPIGGSSRNEVARIGLLDLSNLVPAVNPAKNIRRPGSSSRRRGHGERATARIHDDLRPGPGRR